MFVHKIDDEIYLKLIEVQDAEHVFQLTNKSRKYLKEWLPWLDTMVTVKDTKKFIKFTLKGYSENKSMNTVILYKGEIVGIAGFNEIDWSNRIAYIGYWLGEGYQGKGIMTRVAAGLTNYAFEELHLNRVDIRAAVTNVKSRAIPERLGFTYEGCIREAEWLYNHYVDHAVYGMLASEWVKSQSTN
ncbi:GNAT family protein [Bacillus sp. FJAT-50079]|uniref:GNAT family N-acetyltransferase n=1 Tax=Bacillus sp. FJAT-50079 TaxID=2833577 RepID=UPI001BC98CD7|nr:GNAT family protein [Bacillus sp. FJAT-50079]MBS4210683.1 GNAT family N-acetyltransferase [Bacillus sp. FJAT-50079]